MQRATYNWWSLWRCLQNFRRKGKLFSLLSWIKFRIAFKNSFLEPIFHWFSCDWQLLPPFPTHKCKVEYESNFLQLLGKFPMETCRMFLKIYPQNKVALCFQHSCVTWCRLHEFASRQSFKNSYQQYNDLSLLSCEKPAYFRHILLSTLRCRIYSLEMIKEKMSQERHFP